MARPYKQAIEWVAEQDGPGDDEALDPEHCGNMVTAALVADIYGKPTSTVGRDIVAYRLAYMQEVYGKP